MPQMLTLPLDQVAPAAAGQIRQHFDGVRLQSLAESLKRSGIREPIIVRPHESTPGHYRIVAGERRWRAAQLAGLTEIPCLVDESLSDPKQRLLAQAEENLHREDLNAVEEATVLAELMEAFAVDALDAGALIGRSYQQARRLLQLHTAPQAVKDAIVGLRGAAHGDAPLAAASRPGRFSTWRTSVTTREPCHGACPPARTGLSTTSTSRLVTGMEGATSRSDGPRPRRHQGGTAAVEAVILPTPHPLPLG